MTNTGGGNDGIFSIVQTSGMLTDKICWRLLKGHWSTWTVTSSFIPAAEAKIRRTQASGSAAMWIDPVPVAVAKGFYFLFSNQDGCYFTSLANVWSRDQTCVKTGAIRISQLLFDLIIWFLMSDRVWKADFVIGLTKLLLFIAIECVCARVCLLMILRC